MKHGLFAALVALVMMAAPAPGFAKVRILYTPVRSGSIGPVEVLDALAAIRLPIDAKYNAGWPCGGIGTVRWAPLRSYSLTGRGLTIRCPDNSDHVFLYSALTLIQVTRDNDGTWSCARTAVDAFCLAIGDVEAAKRYADAFARLAQPRKPSDPATDANFQASLEAARAAGDRGEAQRRAQVQAETLIADNRLEAASRLLGEAVRASPDWAQGHYNLALVYGKLEMNAEAITEMRRYLHLLPGATDARAAQDQIYAWEVLLDQK